ncbi:MAG: hypothetical protein RLZZ505_127 [Verrucomicrobiota bacterium]|jgi:hypothetical protein
MKAIRNAILLLGAASSAQAGDIVVEQAAPTTPNSGDWANNLIRPMTNPTLFDLAVPTTNIRPIFLNHVLPDFMNTTAGNLPVGGDVQLYALQFEYAFSDRLSLVATKDGYVVFDPDATLNDQNGFANLGAGLKYAFILDPEAGHALSGSMTFELPTGNSDVLQGEGKGIVNLILSGVKTLDDWQFAGSTGVSIPFSGQQSTNGFLSAHVSREVTPWFIPLFELNVFSVLSPGEGGGNFNGQAGGAVPGIIEFEGNDLFNIGAVNADENRQLVTAALGFRSKITDSIQTGIAYEIPLTSDENSVIDNRLTLDLVWRF